MCKIFYYNNFNLHLGIKQKTKNEAVLILILSNIESNTILLDGTVCCCGGNFIYNHFNFDCMVVDLK